MKLVALLAVTLILININVTAQSCTLSCPENVIVQADSGKEGAIVTFPAAASLGIGDCGTITYSKPSGSFFRIGSHSIIATTSFGQKIFFTVTVTDNEPPVLSPISLSSNKLLPTNNRMKKVGVYYTASDNAREVNTVLSVISNDTESKSRDWEVINNHLIHLKASHLPDGTQRIYTITVTSTDVAGNRTTRITSIAVSNANTGFATNHTAVAETVDNVK